MTTLPHRAEGDLGHVDDHIVLADHNNGTTNVHGIADTSALDTATARDAAIAAIPALASGPDIFINPPVSGVQSIQVLSASHNLWSPLRIRATSDQTVNNSAAPVNDTALAISGIPSGEYDLDAMILYDATNTAKFRATWAFSGTATMPEWWTYALPSSYAGTGNITFPGSNFQPQTSLTANMQFGGGGTTPGTVAVARIWGNLLVTAAGTLTFQWAQGTATVENTLRKLGSRVTLRKVV